MAVHLVSPGNTEASQAQLPRFGPDGQSPERPHLERSKGAAVAKGYVRFFEPDVYVEADGGLLEKAGLGALRQDPMFHSQVITLKELFEPRPELVRAGVRSQRP
jgi:hypothetical protein